MTTAEVGFYSGGIISFIAFAWVAYRVWSKNYRLETTGKVLWTLAAFFFSVFTAIVYFLVEKGKENEVQTVA